MSRPACLNRSRPVYLGAVLLLVACTISACGGGGDGGGGPVGVPARITDLEAVAGSGTSVTLAWTVPGAMDKAAGLHYDLRYVPLGGQSLDRALWTMLPAPVSTASTGQRQQHMVTGLASGATYVFSLAASLDGGDWSEPSTFAVGTAASQPDATPPARLVDLVQHRGEAASVTVAWSLAGDDSIYGRATAYEVRYATAGLSDATWNAAQLVVAAPVAHPNPGKLQVTVDGLVDGQSYDVGVVAIDDVGNRSRVSNVVSVRPGMMRTRYVRADGTGDYATIDAAVHAALPGDVVLVAAGTYDWFAQTAGDTVTSMVTVLRDQTDFTIRGEDGAAATILDGREQGRVMYVTGGTFGSGADRTWAGVTIEGFTFTNGRAMGVEGQLGPPWAGAGLAAHLSDTVVRACVFRHNASVQGGAVWLGGQGAARLEDCLVEDNTADYGGGVMLINSEPVMGLDRCVIRNNHATMAGGGLFATNVGVVIDNLQVYGNISADKGGGVYLSSLHAGSRMEGATIVGNRGVVGGGLRVATSMTIELQRCLIANNLFGGAVAAIENGNVAVGCSLVFGNVGGNTMPALYTDLGGNLSVDPLLCVDHLHPTALSPCLPANRAGGDGCGLIGALGDGCGN